MGNVKITVFDEHHEAFIFWHEALARGEIRKGATLLHVDGHSDLAIPRLTESVYCRNHLGFAKRQLNIGNFILPAVMRGIFKEVIFLSRGGEKKQPRRKSYIGSLGGKGVWLNHGFDRNKLTRRLYPDSREWFYTVTDALDTLNMKDIVLDIDLDYFYGYLFPQPPVQIRLSNAQVAAIKKVSTSDDKYRFPLKLFSVRGNTLNPGYGGKFRDVICNDSREWIECAIENFVHSLTVRPKAISICRSVKTGFTPARYAQFTERTMIRYLRGEQKKGIDPCTISAPFQVYPHVIRTSLDTLYNPLLDDTIKLTRDSRLIWQMVQDGADFRRIFNRMRREYAIEPEILKRAILKFIFRLKGAFVIR